MERPTRRLKPSIELRVDCQIWKACAGYSVNVPPVGSLVYYFPQGHAEHADQSPVQFFDRVYSTPSVRCRVSSVEFLARSDTDEVFVKIRLMPVPVVAAEDDQAEEENDQAEEEKDQAAEENDLTAEENDQAAEENDLTAEENDQAAEENDQAAAENEQLIVDEEEEESVRSASKVLSPSDVGSKVSGLVVTRACAEILPNLDFNGDPPAQMLNFFDLQGRVWEFRHAFIGAPYPVHKFGAGWTGFVNNKKLIHGDSLVFMRNTRTGDLHISVRRAVYCNNSSRRGMGKVSTEEVIEAADRAVAGEQFEIVHYPGGGLLNFVVNAELVDRALEYPWSVNVKVKEKGTIEWDHLQIQLDRGTVVALSGYDTSGLWDKSSSWRMLKIQWDNLIVPVADEWFSPWEVEFDSPPNPPDTQSSLQTVSSIAVAAPRVDMNLSENTDNAGIEGIKDAEPDNDVPNSEAPVQVDAHNRNTNSGSAHQGNNADDITEESFRLLDQVATPSKRKRDGNGSK